MHVSPVSAPADAASLPPDAAAYPVRAEAAPVPAGQEGGHGKTWSVIAAAFAGTIALNVLHVPDGIVEHLVPVLLVAAGCMAAWRWRRAGVRNALRTGFAAKAGEFGGGVYGAISVATLLQLEAADLVSDVAAAGSLGRFVDSLSPGWLISQAVESVKFAVQAGLWPWHWFSAYGMRAVLIAAAAAWGLDALLKLALPRYRKMREARQAAKELA